MSFLRGSANYVWCTTSVLGKGATGAVFQGVNKNNGEPVAVKTFNQISHMRPHDVQVREFEVLKKVKHENIVKLLAIEEEQEGRGKVIVMELCTGGSLFNILDDPENTYGLQEEEFLLVVEHLSAGMKHLRDNNLVHRDLKPGNIMKFISDDGTTIYKLTDFGAARELEEDQQFMSLYGTEEYLHPDMYERAVLKKPVGKTFGATVDLWSIGVTLYHVATGNLPFRPYGGRRNKETMYYITAKKASGVISGIQSTESGPIEWSKELPNNCQLSAGIKKLVTPLLGGLLEVDPQRIWNFERFFNEVTNILSRKLIHIFHVNNLQMIRVYLHPEETYDELQNLLTEQTDITPQNQILLLKEKPLLSIVEETTLGKGYPKFDEMEPIMLFSKENNNVNVILENDGPKFPSFQNTISVESDASLGKVACSVGHVCKRKIEKISKASKFCHNCVQSFTTAISNDLDRVVAKSEKLKEMTKYVERTVFSTVQADKATKALTDFMSIKYSDSNDNFKGNELSNEFSVLSRELLSELGPAIQQLHQRYGVEKTLKQEWVKLVKTLNCPMETRAPARARTLVERLRDSWQHLLRDRASRSLTYNDEQFHVLERIKVGETGKRLKNLLELECQPEITQLADALADWYKVAQTVYLQARILDKDVDAYEKCLEDFATKHSYYHKNSLFKLQETIEKLKNEILDLKGKKKPAKNETEYFQSFMNSLSDMIAIQNEISLYLKDNSSLVYEFQQLLRNLPLNNDQTDK
ncbi:serine/threonine-protein kinase TBK1, putative [Pediculus humanus corporis]|uniref:Serine/threonine-protein kinase TBK1, putative n=1 Tax=Pediculus humanus subsp. corporis TaxID=121224 RepID=E0VQV7_PEDHC|nr:serine/threonine-protein kinase TBK1, putative [Pediculus humanus corporis]EEB15763.1 serine/threonine-protein kinase TBK1, putative [Pediculus humanus corporis]